MRLYLARNAGSGTPGRVFHLRPECATTPGMHVEELDGRKADHFRKALGIRRICLRCRKAVRRAGR